MRVFSLVFGLLLSFTIAVQAQQGMPVKWTFDVEKTDTPNEYQLIMTADVEKGWNIYSQYLESDEGPIATSFNFDKNPRGEYLGKTEEAGHKKEGFDKMFEMNIIKFSDKVKFSQKIKAGKGVNEITGFVEFMTCDDHKCLPPEEIPFKIAIK